MAETEQPGAGIAEIARWYEISRGLLWNWRSQVRRSVLRTLTLRPNSQDALPLFRELTPLPATDSVRSFHQTVKGFNQLDGRPLISANGEFPT